MTWKEWVLIGLATVGAAVLAFLLAQWWRDRKSPRRVGPRIEFRVFLPTAMPIDPERLLAEMRALPGFGPLPHEVGLIASDVRLHLGLVRRENGASAFRPDLFATALGAEDPEIVSRFADAGTFVRVRWASEKWAKAEHALAFCARAAAAIALRSPRSIVYDAVGDRLHRGETFAATRPEPLRTIFESADGTGRVTTRGLRQYGLWDLRARGIAPDTRLLAEAVAEAAAKAYAGGIEPFATIEVEAYGDRFRVTPTEAEDGLVYVRFFRMEATA